MTFSMSGGDKWGYTYSRFSKLDAQKEAPEAVEAVEAEVQEESIEEGYAKYQEGGEVKKSDVKKDEKECEKCKGKGCDHCKGKGKHEVRWQDSDGDGKWYEKGEDVAEEATLEEGSCGSAAKYQEGGEVKQSDVKKVDKADEARMKKFQEIQKNADQKKKLAKEDVFSAEELSALCEQVGISEEQLDEIVGAVLAGVGDAIGGAVRGAGNVVKGVTDAAGNVAGSVTRGVKKAVTGKTEKEVAAENQVKVREGLEATDLFSAEELDALEESLGKLEEGRKDQATLSPEAKSAARDQEKASFSGTPRAAHLRKYDQERARGVKKQPGAKESKLVGDLKRANLKHDLGMKHSAEYQARADKAERQRKAEQ